VYFTQHIDYRNVGLTEVRFRRKKGRTRDGRLLEDHVLLASGPGDGGSVTDASRSRRGFYTSPVASRCWRDWRNSGGWVQRHRGVPEVG